MIHLSRFAHECPDWDFMDIDETCSEFGGCACDFGDDNEQADMYREQWMQELDALNRETGW